MGDEALEAVNEDEAVVVEIRMSDLHAADVDPGRSVVVDVHVVVVVSGGSDGEAFSRGEGFDFGAEG